MARQMQDGSKETDGSVKDRIRNIAATWNGLDSAIQAASSVGGIDIRGIKLIPKYDGWLIVISARVNGECFVCFNTATSSGDVGKVIRISLESPRWREDKYNKLDKPPSP